MKPLYCYSLTQHALPYHWVDHMILAVPSLLACAVLILASLLNKKFLVLCWLYCFVLSENLNWNFMNYNFVKYYNYVKYQKPILFKCCSNIYTYAENNLKNLIFKHENVLIWTRSVLQTCSSWNFTESLSVTQINAHNTNA